MRVMARVVDRRVKHDSSRARVTALSLIVGAYAFACAADAGDPLKVEGGVTTQSMGGPDGSIVGDDALVTGDAMLADESPSVGTDGPTTPPPEDTGAPDVTATQDGSAPPMMDAPPDVPSCSSCAIELKYLCDTTAAMSQEVRPWYDIYNNGTSAQSLTELTVRYYFTADGSQTQTYNCDYAVIGCSLIQGTFVAMATPTATADHYLEISFTGGSIAPGSDTGQIQNRFQDTNYLVMTQTNDYSFDATKTAFTDWANVTVYRNGTLVWGVEP
jgi:hypothetical protein